MTSKYNINNLITEIKLRIVLTVQIINTIEDRLKKGQNNTNYHYESQLFLYREHREILLQTLKDCEDDKPLETLVFPNQKLQSEELNTMAARRIHSVMFKNVTLKNTIKPFERFEVLEELEYMLTCLEVALADKIEEKDHFLNVPNGPQLVNIQRQIRRYKKYISILNKSIKDYHNGGDIIEIIFPRLNKVNETLRTMSRRRRYHINVLKKACIKSLYYFTDKKYELIDNQLILTVKVLCGLKNLEYLQQYQTDYGVEGKRQPKIISINTYTVAEIVDKRFKWLEVSRTVSVPCPQSFLAYFNRCGTVLPLG